MHSGICSTLQAQGIAGTLTIFIGRSSLAGRSYLDLAYLDLNCARGQSAPVPDFVMARSRRDPR
jgi:hypothetical protein